MRKASVARVIREAARRGASPDELGALAVEQALAALAQDREQRARRRDRNRERRDAPSAAEGVVAITAGLVRHAADDPTGVGTALQDCATALATAEDDAVRAMRATGTMSWAAISEAMGVPVRSTIRRWGPQGLDFPGGTAADSG